MLEHRSVSDRELRRHIRRGLVTFAGNRSLKTYGRLRCRPGQTMKRDNRVFFATKEEAHRQGYRPCAHCMYPDYKHWKDGLIP